MNSEQINAMHYATKKKQVLTIKLTGAGKYRGGEATPIPDIYTKPEEFKKEIYESDFMQRYLGRKKELEEK